MARSYRPVDRDQQFLMPPSLREWLPSDHLVWFVLDVVAQLDTTLFHDAHPRSGPGRRAFDPDMLLAVLIYSYATGERSSRRIESLCREHVAFQVLCGRDVPDHTVISRFRQTHQDRFVEVFAQVLVMCARAGMGKVGVVAIDGTKIAANASIFKNRSEGSLRAEADRIEADRAAQAAAQAAAQVVAEAADADATEDALYGDARGDEVAEEFANPSTRAVAIKAALKQIEDDKRRRSDADAEQAQRRAEVWQARGEAAQAKLDALEADLASRAAAWDAAKDHAAAGTGRAPKGRRPDPDNKAAQRARARVNRLQHRADTAGPDRRERERKTVFKANVTDPESRVMNTQRGWVQGYNAQFAVTEDHLILALDLVQDPVDMHQLSPMMAQAQQSAEVFDAEIGLVLADAGYCSEDNLTAEGPDRIIATGKDRKLIDEATTDPRTGTPPTQASMLEQMRHRIRTPEGLAAYRRRGALVEPVNAHIKDQIGLRRFSRRGLLATTSELNLSAAVTNLLKLHKAQTAT